MGARFSSRNLRDQKRPAAYGDSLRPNSRPDDHCATLSREEGGATWGFLDAAPQLGARTGPVLREALGINDARVVTLAIKTII